MPYRTIGSEPVAVYSPAAGTDISGGVTVGPWGCLRVRRVTYQVEITGYTGVTVQGQVRVVSGKFQDYTGAVATADGDIVHMDLMDDSGPYVEYQFVVTGTGSGGSQTITVTRQEEI